MLGFYGERVCRRRPTMFTVGSSTSATFVLPVYIWINVCVREYFKQKHARKLIGDFQYEMSYLLPESPLKVH